jgi:GNAT superfamily N-acetyltransferase
MYASHPSAAVAASASSWVQWAVAEARSNGCVLVELLTHHTRVDAQRFYERLGFARSHVGMTIRF